MMETGSTGDTRVYATKRLLPYHGYDAPPVVDDGFDWKLPACSHYYGREVECGNQRYEIWSPNSCQDPFYPGIRNGSFPLKPPLRPEQRRYDGQLGRFDPTISPQAYDPERPWLGFIRSPRYVSDLDMELVLEPVTLHWVSEPDSGFRGRIEPSFLRSLVDVNSTADAAIRVLHEVRYTRVALWNLRLCAPSAEDLDKLRVVTRYDDAVDRVREVQRQLVEKEGWVRLALCWKESRPRIEDMRSLPIKPADDGLMGVWLNGMPEYDSLYFLTQTAVPCFLIHELTAEEPRGYLVARSFIEGTPIQPLLDPYRCEYTKVAFSQNNSTYTGTEIRGPAFDAPVRDFQSRTRSSSRWQRELTSDDPLPRNAQRSKGPKKDIRESTSDEDVNDTVSLGSKDSDGGEAEPTFGPSVKPKAAPAMAFPAAEATVLTRFLKFAGLPDAFSPDDLQAWLATMNRVVTGCEWRRIYRIPRRPGVDYVVEFENHLAALQIRGLIDPKNGEIRASEFVGETEFGALQQRLVAIERQTESGLTAAAPEPYAGGRYLRQEPPKTLVLPASAVPEGAELLAEGGYAVKKPDLRVAFRRRLGDGYHLVELLQRRVAGRIGEHRHRPVTTAADLLRLDLAVGLHRCPSANLTLPRANVAARSVDLAEKGHGRTPLATRANGHPSPQTGLGHGRALRVTRAAGHPILENDARSTTGDPRLPCDHLGRAVVHARLLVAIAPARGPVLAATHARVLVRDVLVPETALVHTLALVAAPVHDSTDGASASKVAPRPHAFAEAIAADDARGARGARYPEMPVVDPL
ncbi:hypothetical protein C8R47DRAFT_1226258 [Mycena vitilis]|nr:hypothetical protein C8R47DRAFT_1226258 [Mycena vitilis]